MVAIKNYEGLYSVTKDGKVFSHIKNKHLKPFVEAHGYLQVTLYKDMVGSKIRVHRLVAEAYCRKSNSKNWVNHKDGIKANNNASNLEWCTPAENIKHARETGLNRGTKGMKVNLTKRGREARNLAAKKRRLISIDEASEMCEAFETGIFTYTEIANSIGVSQGTVINIIKRNSYA